MKERGLRGVQLAIGDRRLGLVEAAREALPEARCRGASRASTQPDLPATGGRAGRRNVSSKVPSGKMKAVANSGKGHARYG